MNLTAENKRHLGVSVLLILIGIFKIYSKGIYTKTGDFNWFNILIPFGMGIMALIFVVVKIYLDRNKS
jgi:hypothetical protein